MLKYINFSGKLVLIEGKIIARKGDKFVVDFEHNGVEYRGLW